MVLLSLLPGIKEHDKVSMRSGGTRISKFLNQEEEEEEEDNFAC
jgi:hypothetical protein